MLRYDVARENIVNAVSDLLEVEFWKALRNNIEYRKDDTENHFWLEEEVDIEYILDEEFDEYNIEREWLESYDFIGSEVLDLWWKDYREFILNDDEKESIINALDNSGRMLVNSEVEIIDPVVKKYVINIIVRYFEDIDKTAIRTSIRSRLNNYFLNINRNDIIPLSDLISIVEGVDGVDTCDVFFVSEENEKAIIDGSYYTTEKVWKDLEYVDVEKKVFLKYDEDPRIGMDDFGNLKVGEYEICIPKGGWEDRDGNYYTETPEEGKLGPLNIFFVDKVDSSAYNLNMQRKLNTLLKNNY